MNENDIMNKKIDELLFICLARLNADLKSRQHKDNEEDVLKTIKEIEIELNKS